MRQRLKFVAATLVGVAVVAAVAAYWFRPTVLRIAAGPVGSSDVRVIVGYVQALQRERADIRLRLVLSESPADAAAKLEAGQVDLAVVRSDIGIPTKASTVAIMRREAAFFLTRPGSGLTQISGLKGRTIGLVRASAANERILTQILAQHDLTPQDITKVSGTPDEMRQGVQDGKFDALFFVTPLAERMVRTALQTFPRVEGQAPGLLVVAEAEALLADHPALDTVEIVRGAFGANPVLPDSALTTLAVTHRLVAKNELSEPVVSELTRLLVTLRPQIVREVPAANQIDLPSTEDRAVRLPNHPGAVAYIDGETKTFFERYGDYLYLGIMGFSLLGSALAALFSTMSRRPETVAPDKLMRDLVSQMDRVRVAENAALLESIEDDAEIVIGKLLRISTSRRGDTSQIAAVALLISEFRHTLASRRQALVHATPVEKPPVAVVSSVS
ncbi:MAG: TAXI family TRAP transporter solute-binding subunit [Rhabdaerophilum sp.]